AGRAPLLPRDRVRPDDPAEPARAPLHLVVAPAASRDRVGRPRDLPRRAMSVLRAEAVHKFYDDLEVLRGVTVDVEPGQVKVIIGPSRAGKSTLLRGLACLEEPERGAITLEGRRPEAGEVGMVFQRFNLFQNMTALENVMCGLVEGRRQPKAEARAAALEFLDRVGLADKGAQYPDELSGGQQQRVAIARALEMHREEVLFHKHVTAH